jgi:hypothetical protein
VVRVAAEDDDRVGAPRGILLRPEEEEAACDEPCGDQGKEDEERAAPGAQGLRA